jgi:hypothetical protein
MRTGYEEELELEPPWEEQPQRKPIVIPPIVICGGPPNRRLTGFQLNRAIPTPRIEVLIHCIACVVVRRERSSAPVRNICLEGHTDNTGPVSFNNVLGLQRAKEVQKRLARAIDLLRPGLAARIAFSPSSGGAGFPLASNATPQGRALNRRVEVFLRTGGRKLPPDDASCGVPKPQESEFGREFEEWERGGAGAAVQPKLCLFLDSSNKSHRNHFHHQATGTAKRIGAIGSPDPADCKKRIGPTPYSTGADIIAAMRAAFHCSGKKPLRSVHIFGHSGSYGIFGAIAGTAGLYQNSYSLDTASRGGGGRIIADIPTDILSDHVIFVLHGCNQASGCNEKGDDDNFARSLLEHLSAALKAPKVFGHYNAGCAGRNNSWCQYSKTLPKGKAGSAPVYADPGGCKS